MRGGRQTRRGACDSEISIVRGPLCVLCEVYFGGAGGVLRREGKRKGWGSYPGPSDKRNIVLANVWRHLWRNAII